MPIDKVTAAATRGRWDRGDSGPWAGRVCGARTALRMARPPPPTLGTGGAGRARPAQSRPRRRCYGRCRRGDKRASNRRACPAAVRAGLRQRRRPRIRRMTRWASDRDGPDPGGDGAGAPPTLQAVRPCRATRGRSSGASGRPAAAQRACPYGTERATARQVREAVWESCDPHMRRRRARGWARTAVDLPGRGASPRSDPSSSKRRGGGRRGGRSSGGVGRPTGASDIAVEAAAHPQERGRRQRLGGPPPRSGRRGRAERRRGAWFAAYPGKVIRVAGGFCDSPRGLQARGAPRRSGEGRTGPLVSNRPPKTNLHNSAGARGIVRGSDPADSTGLTGFSKPLTKALRRGHVAPAPVPRRCGFSVVND